MSEAAFFGEPKVKPAFNSDETVNDILRKQGVEPLRSQQRT